MTASALRTARGLVKPAAEPAPETEAAAAGRVPWGRRDSLAICGLALAGLFLFAWGIGTYPLWDPWESMHAQAMLEMAERGDRVTPWLDGRANPSQPILIYWAMAAPMAIGGNTEFTARLPAALAAVGGVLLLFYCLRRLRGFDTALVAAAVLATLPQYFYMARQAMPDMLLTASLTGVLGFFALARFQETRRRLHLVLFYACLGLALLAKGPLALVLTGGALVLFGLFQLDRDRVATPATWWPGLRRLARRYEVGRGALVFLLVAAPWHLTMFFRHGLGFAGFQWSESLRHFTDSVDGGDGTSEFYVLDLFHGMYPWISLLPLSLVYLFHGTTRFDEDARQKWYFVAWCTTVFALFTLAATKFDHYFLPMAPGVAVLVALVFEAWFRERAPFWVAPGMLISIPFALLPIRDFLIEGDRYMFRVFADSPSLEHPSLGLALKAFLGAWSVALLLAAFRRRSWIVAGFAIAVVYGHAVYMTHSVLPQHSAGHTLRGYTDLVERVREPDAELVFYGRSAYSVHYYFGRERFRRFAAGEADELAARVAGKPHVYIIAESDELAGLSRALERSGSPRWVALADEHSDYVLLTNSQAALGRR